MNVSPVSAPLRGRNESYINRNYVKIHYNWPVPNTESVRTRVVFYLAEFTNYHNMFWAVPGYRVKLKRDGQIVRDLFVPVAKVEDENFRNQPTARHIMRSRNYGSDIDTVIVSRRVTWSFLEPAEPNMRYHETSTS